MGELFDIRKRNINWQKTGKNLFLLRDDNINLRRFVCHSLKFDSDKCLGGGDCANCSPADMDNRISRQELADVFCVSESVVVNWESGRTPIGLEDLLFYAQIARVELKDIIVFD